MHRHAWQDMDNKHMSMKLPNIINNHYEMKTKIIMRYILIYRKKNNENCQTLKIPGFGKDEDVNQGLIYTVMRMQSDTATLENTFAMTF